MTWVSPLDPRDAFYGGRTGMVKCYHPAEEGEQIFYQDFTSLYPTINKYGTYPLGHPQIIVNPESKHPRLLWNCQGRCARFRKASTSGPASKIEWKADVSPMCKVCGGPIGKAMA